MPRARKPLRVLLAGASGLIGRELVRQLREDGDEAVQLVRRPATAADERTWDPGSGTVDAELLAGFDAIVNLAGASIGRIPWTPAYRREIRESRIVPTTVLAEALARISPAARRPKTLITASAAGFYGDRPGQRLTEFDEQGKGWLPQVVADWEAASRLAPRGVRVVQARTAVVVARTGGLAPVRTLTGVGLGSRFGSGGQHWPWISLHDEAAAIRHLLRSKLAGPVNLAGPTPATSDRVTHEFARALHRPYLFTVPSWGIRLLGEAGQRLLLDSMLMVPDRLMADGFRWQHETVEAAILAALKKRS
ncbi:MAG: TIGR01777 family protein [Micrococcales bacterium]|nr:TIGR01777 family protein [Micrococcales bacterium]